MRDNVFLVKSLEEDLATKTLIGKKKVTYQTVLDIVKNKRIRPNTNSFGRKKRLSCTILSDEYNKTYRPQGVIFQTSSKPDYVIPFDLVLASATNNIVVHYYRIKNNLHIYYNHTLIPNFEKFVFGDFNSMINMYHFPKDAWRAVNKFRKINGFGILPKQKFRLAEYNEAVFHKTIKIKPIALFGYKSETRKVAKKLGLPCYASAREFYKELRKKMFHRTLLIIGRFQPIHRGHLSLIKRYHNAGFFIKIGVGSSQKSGERHNPLKFKEREEMIKQALKENKINKYQIYPVPDIDEDSNYVAHVLKRVGDFDTFVTGNKSILKLFGRVENSNWSIESFEESSTRPGGNITSGIIRKNWMSGPSRRGLSKSSYKYLKSIDFSSRLKSRKI